MNASIIKISRREREILKLMSNGFTSKEIGKKLYISNLTVDKHKRNLLTKFNVRNSVQLVVHADRLGLIRDDKEIFLRDESQSSNHIAISRRWTDMSIQQANA